MNILYAIIHPFVIVAMKYYFKTVHVTGLENLPKDKPVILAVSHQNAFLDALLAVHSLKKQAYFLTRSDVFKSSWSNIILKALNLIPIYRQQDGTDISKNTNTFNWCGESLNRGKWILIFPEGTCEPKKRLLKSKKGIARIAWSAIEDFPELDLQIIPVGINYSDHFGYHEQAWVEYGKAIDVQTAKRENSNKAFFLKNILSKIDDHFNKTVVNLLENYEEEDKKLEKIIWNQSITSGSQLVKALQSEESIIEKKDNLFLLHIIRLPILLIGITPYLIGYFVKIVTQTFFRFNEFHASAQFVLNMIFQPIYMILSSIAIGIMSPQPLMYTVIILVLQMTNFYWLAELSARIKHFGK